MVEQAIKISYWKIVGLLCNLRPKSGWPGVRIQGDAALRTAIADKWYNGVVDADEVFVSDGAKCDIARLQLLFGPGMTVAVQDPSYPAYVDTSVMMGRTKEFDARRSQYTGITYLPCTIENGFFPDLSAATDADVIFFCRFLSLIMH